jgi:pyruvate/2-oxoglutarate/acetoin dehydrogenase E1 component/TPP-dependent pyruvate/acetoin dehydrogenase alpha subunit
MDFEKIYKSLYRIRRAEEEIIRIYPSDKIKSPVHLSIGQEAISVAVCEALGNKDVVFGTYRGHALYLAKTADLNGFFAELYGKSTGCSSGKGGSMHLANVSKGMMGTSAIVASTIPQAVGYAYSLKVRKEKAVVAVFFGDGATEEGVFHESLNFASLKNLPIIFICENNLYAIHTHQSKRQKTLKICDIAQAHGIESKRIENNNSIDIYRNVERVSYEMRNAKRGPLFLECMTYRWNEHVGPGDDSNLGYRTKEEIDGWRNKDELKVIASKIPAKRRFEIEVEIETEIEKAIEFAEKSQVPEPKDLYTHIFKEKISDVEIKKTIIGNRELSYANAIQEATDQEMEKDESVVIFGLDVDDPKCILGTTRNLLNKFGSSRVFGTPISEDAMTGVGIGMAISNLRPIHVHIRMDFLLLAMNQLINIAAKMYYMYGGQVSVPIVIRTIIGRSWGQGAQHSQAFHSYLMHVPGLKVVAPSNSFDAKGCLLAAIRDDNPVIFIEHRLLHSKKSVVPKYLYEVKPGKARVTLTGNDITIVGISYMQIECIKAHKYLKQVGINAEIIDPIWLSPLDTKTICDSVRKTRHLIIVDNGWTTCGAANEIAARIYQEFEELGPIKIRQMGFERVSCPTSPDLEKYFYPNPQSIASLAFKLLNGEETDWYPKEILDEDFVEFKGPF